MKIVRMMRASRKTVVYELRIEPMSGGRSYIKELEGLEVDKKLEDEMEAMLQTYKHLSEPVDVIFSLASEPDVCYSTGEELLKIEENEEEYEEEGEEDTVGNVAQSTSWDENLVWMQAYQSFKQKKMRMKIN